jgi:hypothetical protein
MPVSITHVSPQPIHAFHNQVITVSLNLASITGEQGCRIQFENIIQPPADLFDNDETPRDRITSRSFNVPPGASGESHTFGFKLAPQNMNVGANIALRISIVRGDQVVSNIVPVAVSIHAV